MIRRREQLKKKSWGEWFIQDYSFPEKMVAIMWCCFPYLIYVMSEGIEVWYRLILSVGIWILLSLLCFWFGSSINYADGTV